MDYKERQKMKGEHFGESGWARKVLSPVSIQQKVHFDVWYDAQQIWCKTKIELQLTSLCKLIFRKKIPLKASFVFLVIVPYIR